MHKKLSLYVLAFILFSCSDETIEKPFSRMSTLKGTVQLINEFGQLDEIQSGALFILSTPSNHFEAMTDSKGAFLLENIPTGTYNFEITKAGYAKWNGTLTTVGGEKPVFLGFNLSGNSNTKVTGLSGSIPYSNQLVLKGTIIYNSPLTQFVRLACFMSNVPDVSPQNYQFSSSVYFFQNASGSVFTTNVYFPNQQFPSGSTAYVVVYGLASSSPSVYNFIKGKYEFTGLGTVPSNIISIKIP